jgi:HEAT repeat protein
MDKRKAALVGFLRDEDENIRSTAAEALERLEIRANLDSFSELLASGGKLEKLRAVYALGNLRGQQVTTLLLKGVKDPIEDVRAASVRVLGDFSDSRALHNLVESLKDESPVVARVAIEALSHYREPQLLGPIMQMLKSKDLGVVERAIEMVGRSGDKRAEQAMLYFSVKGNINMRCRAIKALGVLED